ncbi:MAG: efflux RND transporter permease subunit [Bernardetiaceae bacterium]|nr:efflux RND transporter permease subunit [Bernardetiaceae bacterium]
MSNLLQISSFRIVLIFLIISILGVFCLPFLNVELNPRTEKPQLYVSYSVPTASPEIVERLATAPLENMLSQLTGLKKIQSASHYHRGQITLTFNEEADMPLKKFEVSMLLRQAAAELSPLVSYPLVNQSRGSSRSSEERPVLVYAVNADFPNAELVRRLKLLNIQRFSGIADIKDIDIRGIAQNAIYITYDADKMRAQNITHYEVQQHLNQLQQTRYWGRAQLQNQAHYWLEMPPSFEVEKLNEVILRENPILHLKDIATWKIAPQPVRSHYRIDGKESVTVSFYIEKNSNTVEIARQIKAQIKLIESEEGRINWYKEWDESDFLEKELHKTYKRAGLSLAVLAFFILLLQRNIKSLMILFSSLFVNLAISLFFVYLLGIQIHLYSIAGIAISFGLILDNALVMLSSLMQGRHKSMFVALLAASLTTAAALLLVFFLPEEQKDNLSDFAAVVALNLAVSLPIALWFTPALYRLWELERTAHRRSFRQKRRSVSGFRTYKFLIQKVVYYRKIFIVLVILGFGTPLFMLPSKVQDWEWYNETVGSSIYQNKIRPYSDVVLGGTLRLFVKYAFEKYNYRENTKPLLYVSATMPKGMPLSLADSVVRSVESFLSQQAQIEKFVSHVNAEQATITISFPESVEQRSEFPFLLKNALIIRSLGFDGIKWNIYGVGLQGFSTGGGEGLSKFRLEMRGYNYLALEEEAQKVADRLLAHKRVQEVNTNERLSYKEKATDEYVWQISPQGLAHIGLTPQDFARDIHLIAPSDEPALYLPYQNKIIPAYLQSRGSETLAMQDIRDGNLPNTASFKHFTSFEKERSSPSLYKENRLYIRVIGFDYTGSQHFGQKHVDKVLAETKNALPVGYSIEQIEHNTWDWNKAKSQYELLLILLLVVFFICSILFESLQQALLMLLVIPFSFMGVFITFGGLGVSFDQGGYAAFVLLGGLAVNAAIFIINDYNGLRKAKHRDAFLKAIYYKAYPILLTVVSTFLGLLPFLWEDEVFWYALAAGVSGGLFFSLLGVFLWLPVLYYQNISIRVLFERK